MRTHHVLDFIAEMGHLKEIRHEGWRFTGVSQPETVAAHSLRAAQLGFLLAKMEGYHSPHEVATMVVFHDMGEARVGDLHAIARHYCEVNEEQAVRDQTGALGEVGEEIADMWKECEEISTEAGVLARDADKLEQAFTALEYMERGIEQAEALLVANGKLLKTTSAQKIFAELRSGYQTDWWQRVNEQQRRATSEDDVLEKRESISKKPHRVGVQAAV